MFAQTTRTLYSTGRRFAASLHSPPTGVLPVTIRILVVALFVAGLAPLAGRSAGAAGGGDRVNVTALACPSWPVGTPVNALSCDYFPNLSFWIQTSEGSITPTTNDMGAAWWTGNTSYVWIEETVPAGYRVEIYCGLYRIVPPNGEYEEIGQLLDNGDGSTSTTIDVDQAQAVNCTFYNIPLEPFGGRAVEFDDGVLANGIADEDPGFVEFVDPTLVTDPTAATVSIDVHSCADDFVGSGFYQYLTACTSEQGLYGVPLKLTDGDGKTGYLYSKPDGTGGAAPLDWANIAPGPVTVSEVSDARVHESVVFCSIRAAGNQPGALDGTNVPVVNGSIAGNLNPGDELICDWYRFPGGVAATPTDTQPAGHGGEITISKRICLEPLTDSGLLTGYAETDLDAYLAACQSAQDGVKFTLSAPDGEMSRDTVDGRVAWSDLAAGDYTIAEAIPDGYGDPVVFCEGNVPGRQYLTRNLVQHDATGGFIAFALEQDEVVSCDWFNISVGGTNPYADTDGDGDETGTDPLEGEGGWTGQDGENGQDGYGDAVDSDGDGIGDEDELFTYYTDPYLTDSDDDGLGDDEELFFLGTDPLSDDTDGDQLVDGDEVYLVWTDPVSFDTDGDGVDDGTEAYYNGTDPLDSASV